MLKQKYIFRERELTWAQVKGGLTYFTIVLLPPQGGPEWRPNFSCSSPPYTVHESWVFCFFFFFLISVWGISGLIGFWQDTLFAWGIGYIEASEEWVTFLPRLAVQGEGRRITMRQGQRLLGLISLKGTWSLLQRDLLHQRKTENLIWFKSRSI